MSQPRTGRPIHVWTDDRVDRLRELYAKGWSASAIARDLGAGVTRNAVIGKTHRLGLPRRGGVTNRPMKPRRPAYRPPGSQRFDRPMVLRPRKQPKLKLALLAGAAPEPPLNIAFADLGPKHCRWPTSDGAPFTYCGHDKASGQSYCAPHCREAWSGSPLRTIRYPWELTIMPSYLTRQKAA